MNAIKAQAFYLVPDALKSGVLLGQLPVVKGKPKAFIIAAPVSIDDKVYRLLIEVRSDANMQRLYVHEVVLREISPLHGFKSGADSEEEQPSAHARGDIYNFMLNLRKAQAEKSKQALAVNEDTQGFSTWFRDSKVVDVNGNPLLVYHGSSSEDVIEKFDRLFLVSKGKKDGLDSIGTWFTDNKDRVTDYGNKKVYAAYIRLVNPLILQSFDELREYWSEVQESNPDKQVQKAYKVNNHHGDSTDFVAELSAKYDGIIIKKHLS